MDRARIEASGATDLAGVLAMVPGVEVQGGHPVGTGVYLQGLGSERVLVLVDGEPVVGRIAGEIDLTRLPVADVERVEVVKGPQSTLYGSEAMGGVINLITRAPGPGAVAGGVQVTGGSRGRRDAVAHARASTGAVDWTVRGGVRDVDLVPGQNAPLDAGTRRWDGKLALPSPATGQTGRVGTLILAHGGDRGWLAAASRDGRWTPGQMAAFLTTLPLRPETWDRLEEFAPEVQHLFWLRKEPWGLENSADAERAAKKLAKHSRVYAALDVLAHFAVKGTAEISPEVVLSVLKKASETPFPVDVHPANLAWEVGQLLDHLEEFGQIDDQMMVELEWAFLPIFEHAVPPHSRPPRALLREIVRDPPFFAEIVALFHRSSTAERREISDEDVDRGRRGYALIESWRMIQGAKEDGSVDGATLREWVLRARSELRERGLDSAGDTEIGKVLRYSPDDPDGAWPAVAVRDVIEELSSEDLEDGIEIEVYYSREWTSRDPTEGGIQERELVQQYTGYAALLSDRWPRAAAMLRSIADTYRRDAGRHDVDAELAEDFW